MNTPFLMLLAAVAAAAAGYAHRLLPRHTEGERRVWFTRLVLVVVGIAVGSVGARYESTPFAALLTFVIGFGAVHAPAAVILFIKQQRGAAKS